MDSGTREGCIQNRCCCTLDQDHLQGSGIEIVRDRKEIWFLPSIHVIVSLDKIRIEKLNTYLRPQPLVDVAQQFNPLLNNLLQDPLTHRKRPNCDLKKFCKT